MTWTTFFLATLASLGIHRLWNYEAITQPLRVRLSKLPWVLGKILSCPPCNALWIGMSVCTTLALTQHPAVLVALYGLATYPILRLAVWMIATSALIEARLKNIPSPAKGGCGGGKPMAPLIRSPEPISSAAQQKVEIDRHTEALTFEKRVVLLTMLHTFESSYSLTSVILDQARMLAMNPRWLVELWVTTTCRDTPPSLPPNVRLRRVVPPVPCEADKHDEKAVKIVTDRLRAELIPLGNAAVIAHDLLFVSQFLNYAAAIHALGDLRGFSWLHVCHSGPSHKPALEANDPRRFRYTLPAGNHTIIALSTSHVEGMRMYYATDRVEIIPNARDPLTLTTPLTPDLTRLIQNSGLADADVVQIYPVSTTRFEGKGMSKLLRLFAEMVKTGAKVRLVVCNPHANGETGKAIVAHTRAVATNLGLPAECVVFTSEALPGTAATGLPATWVSTLFGYANLFAFPTRGEASSLVLYEAILHGNLLVLNSDVPALKDAFPANMGARFWSWGTSDDDHGHTATLARGILDDLAGDPREQAKRFVLKNRGLHSLSPRWAALVNQYYPGTRGA